MRHKRTRRTDTHSSLPFLPPHAVRKQDVPIQGGCAATRLVDNKATPVLLLQHMHTNDPCFPRFCVCLMREGPGKDRVCTLRLNCPPDCACLWTVWGTMVQWWICILKQKCTTFTFELWEFIVNAIFQALTICCISVRIILICTKNKLNVADDDLSFNLHF